jgi:hypothetical protein
MLMLGLSSIPERSEMRCEEAHSEKNDRVGVLIGWVCDYVMGTQS